MFLIKTLNPNPNTLNLIMKFVFFGALALFLVAILAFFGQDQDTDHIKTAAPALAEQPTLTGINSRPGIILTDIPYFSVTVDTSRGLTVLSELLGELRKNNIDVNFASVPGRRVTIRLVKVSVAEGFRFHPLDILTLLRGRGYGYAQMYEVLSIERSDDDALKDIGTVVVIGSPISSVKTGKNKYLNLSFGRKADGVRWNIREKEDDYWTGTFVIPVVVMSPVR